MDASQTNDDVQTPFQARIDVLERHLAQRDRIVGRIEAVLNAQRRPIDYLRDTALLTRDFEACFTGTGDSGSHARLRSELERSHWADGFRPRDIAGLHNGPADPAEMMARAFHLWQQTRWPGRNGRLRYAHTLFNLFIVRCLELLSVRVWDDGAAGAGERLAQIQGMLDRLWSMRTVDQPVLVRDARWLMQLAQSLATDDLGAYFAVAARIADTLPRADRMALHAAGVRMAGGHLRSQIRYHAINKSVDLDDAGLVLNTRTSNALDFALLIQDLVPLLEAYEDACRRGDSPLRLELADAICQGVSPDPELFLSRVDLLAAYSMIESLFVSVDDAGHSGYTAAGHRHLLLLQDYQARIAGVSSALQEDASRFQPVAGAYSPYGVIYGFSPDLLKHMVLKALQPEAVTHFSLEDVFVSGGSDRLAWVNGWRKLPHLTPELEQLFEYPQAFAEAMFDRIDRALRTRAAAPAANAVHTGRLFVVAADDPPAAAIGRAIPELPVRYLESSDRALVASQKAVFRDERQLLSDRREGKYLVSYATPGGWVAIGKALLTEVLGAGQDAKVDGVPPAAADALTLMCPGLAGAPR